MSDIVPAHSERSRQMLAAVSANCERYLSQNPHMVSFDPLSDDNLAMSIRARTDPGIEAAKRNGWSGIVNNWTVAPYEVPRQDTGEIETVYSLCLFTPEGELVRLTGGPSIKSFEQLVRAVGAERCSLGIRVKCVKRQSSTPGRSYWQVLPD